MKINRLITLLKLLQSADIEDVDEILEYDELILDILVDCGIYIDKALKFIGSEDGIEKLKVFAKIVKNGLVDEDINYESWNLKMLQVLSASSASKKKYIVKILLCRELQEANLINEAIKIINESQNEFNAKYASDVLCNSRAIKAGIAIEGAKVINESNNEFNAKYALLVLCDYKVIEEGIAIEGAKIINESKNEHNAASASYLLRTNKAIEAGIAIEGAKIINESKNDFNASLATVLLRTNKAIEAGIAIEGAKVINMADTDEIAKEIYDYITYNVNHSNIIKEAMELVYVLNLAKLGKEIKISKEASIKHSKINELLLYLYTKEDDEIKVSELKRIKPKNNQ